jgi:hypothetical protein
MGLQGFCIHGHFYQPPREDPLTGEIPQEQGAAPYRNWNERINAQCYRPNAELGNFEHISFNIGPTLAGWMTSQDPESMTRIIQQNDNNVKRFGVGNAMAQPYNHTILPLANREDKITQVIWGKIDFKKRFGYNPSGMWLPETAVDIETLDILAENDITYTILAPWQAKNRGIDVTKPYRAMLNGGKEITLFFYHQDLSTRISFDPASTSNADAFILNTLLPNFNSPNGKNGKDQIILAASDGEVYGHHQPFRDKFLSYLMGGAMKGKPVKVTYPALWLRDHPAEETVVIEPDTSWSCHHGITRWKGPCSCTPNSKWKAPLRRGLNQIGDLVDEQFLIAVKPYLTDPWQLRHQFMHVICGNTTTKDLLAEVIGKRIPEEKLKVIRYLLAAQFEKQRMFTSCGWFFDDFDRIEPRNNVAYAAQAIWLTEIASGLDLAARAKSLLKGVTSWRTRLSADTVFDNHMARVRQFQSSPLGRLFLNRL